MIEVSCHGRGRGEKVIAWVGTTTRDSGGGRDGEEWKERRKDKEVVKRTSRGKREMKNEAERGKWRRKVSNFIARKGSEKEKGEKKKEAKVGWTETGKGMRRRNIGGSEQGNEEERR